jgi:hypothetical protein
MEEVMEYAKLEQYMARSMRQQGCLEYATGKGEWVENGGGSTKITFIIVFYWPDVRRAFCGIELAQDLSTKNFMGVMDDTDAWEKFQKRNKITLGDRQNIDELIMD